MSSTTTTGYFKCHHCHRVSPWTGKYDDVCTHCGHSVGEQSIKEEVVRDENRNKGQVMWVMIHPSDNPLVKLLKRGVQSTQIIFIAVVSFLVWLIAILAG